MRLSERAFVLLFAAVLPFGMPAPVFGVLQGQTSPRSQWMNSPHAGSMDTPEEVQSMNREGCARCHTAQGYHQEILAGEESGAPYADPVGLTCQACHKSGGAGGPVGPLWAGSAESTCRGCHDEIVANRPDYLSWCSQWGIFDGTGGAETPGGDYGTSAHSTLEKGCVSCHMAQASEGVDPNRVGGHTFRVKTKGESPIHFNPGACLSCHGEMTLEQVDRSQAGVRELMVTLAALLPQKPVPTDSTVSEPRYPSDPSLTEIQQRASFNYWLVQKDGSFGVHNPVYTRDLLARSIEELQRAPVDEAERAAGPTAQIDHVIWAVPDLGLGEELFRAMSGVDPSVGGVHPGRGTRNSLVSAGTNTYVEIIAPDPAQMPFDPAENPVQAFAYQISIMEVPEVDMFAFSSPDLEAVAAVGRELGLEVIGPSPGERRTPAGEVLRWSHVDFIGHDFGQFLPFAINWLDSMHPSTTSPKGALLQGITVEHPRAEELRKIYEALGIPAAVIQADEPRIIALMSSENGPFKLTSGTSLLAYYAARATKNIK